MSNFQRPISWSDQAFSMDHYDVVYLPGGHDKGVRQIIDSETIHHHLQAYFPKTKRDASDRKILGALCHGVQVLAFTPASDSSNTTFPLSSTGQIDTSKSFKSVIHSCRTSALPGQLETGIYHSTRLALGDYYKTYGAGTPNVETYVKYGLDDEIQFHAGPAWYSPWLGQPFLVEDEQYRYVSARFPPDAEALAKRIVEMTNQASETAKS